MEVLDVFYTRDNLFNSLNVLTTSSPYIIGYLQGFYRKFLINRPSITYEVYMKIFDLELRKERKRPYLDLIKNSKITGQKIKLDIP